MTTNTGAALGMRSTACPPPAPRIAVSKWLELISNQQHIECECREERVGVHKDVGEHAQETSGRQHTIHHGWFVATGAIAQVAPAGCKTHAGSATSYRNGTATWVTPTHNPPNLQNRQLNAVGDGASQSLLSRARDGAGKGAQMAWMAPLSSWSLKARAIPTGISNQ